MNSKLLNTITISCCILGDEQQLQVQKGEQWSLS